MIKYVPFGLVFGMLAACATTDVQPMSNDTFKVQTHAAPACGPSGARNVAFKAAAIEVIRKGGDKFIILGDQSDMGMQGDIFTGFNTNYAQGMVVKMIPDQSSEARNALSARQQLGADWQAIVAKGVPPTCS
ncbi:hypothetical protein [Pseudogemmobacter blasticus]|nr:hypothetical protein [Fuscovulum blasticum]